MTGVLALAFAGAVTAGPVKIIFDTDMICDFDDVGALACLHALADAGECEILATVSSTRGNASVAAIEVVNGYYGRPEIPVGAPKGIGVLGERAGATVKVDPQSPLGEKPKGFLSHWKYRKLALDYPQWVRHPDADDAPDALEVYRQVLAKQADRSVVICSVGFLTNLRRLVEDCPKLVEQKVCKWVAMACNYPRGKEYNSLGDPVSSRIALEKWPTPIVFSDFQYGMDVFAGRGVADADEGRNPVADVFRGNMPSLAEVAADPAQWQRDYFGVGGRAAWDETAVLVAVRGEATYCNLHRGTYRMLGDTGENEWVPDEANGPHVRLTEKTSKNEIGKIIDELIWRKPGVRRRKD